MLKIDIFYFVNNIVYLYGMFLKLIYYYNIIYIFKINKVIKDILFDITCYDKKKLWNEDKFIKNNEIEMDLSQGCTNVTMKLMI